MTCSIICSLRDGLIKVIENEYSAIMKKACWRIVPYGENKAMVSFEGPMLYELRLKTGETHLISDLSPMRKDHSWWSPVGEPHITDIVFFNGAWVASIEVGGIVVSEDKVNWDLVGLKGVDAHNLLALDDRLFVAAASGIYYTSDLENWEKADTKWYYNHAIISCGEKLYSHVMDNRAVIVSEDGGRTWRQLDADMQPPTYGQTSIVCIDSKKILYAPNKAYEINTINEEIKETKLKLPNVRRITKI